MSPNDAAERGVFIVIEGTDGSGKGTQFGLIQDRLQKAGHDIATFDFPQYDQPSSYFVKEYLNGKYGSAEAVGPYTASLFYALDRYEAAPKIREALDAGKVVIANRFVGSNMGHQGTKFAHSEERRGYFIWLDNLEFQMLGIPRPDLNIVLRMPAEIAQQLVDQKAERSYTDKKRDIHEADLSHLQRAVEVYDDLCQLFPKDFTRIDCVRGDRLLDIDEVNNLVWEKLSPLLPLKKPGQAQSAIPVAAIAQEYSADQLYTPEALDPSMASAYQDALATILERRRHLLDRLAATPDDQAEIGQLLLPLAASVGQNAEQKTFLPTPINQLDAIAAEQLASTYAGVDDVDFALVDYWPRNELRTVPHLLYPHTTLPLATLVELSDKWSYEIKADTLDGYVADTAIPRLKNVGYVFDFASDVDTLLALMKIPGLAVQHQALTPRYGYSVPEAAGDVSDAFDECFDLSMQLYSQMQASGNAADAPYAMLLGHKVRMLLTLTDADFEPLQAALVTPKLQALYGKIIAAIGDVHPTLAETHRQQT